MSDPVSKLVDKPVAVAGVLGDTARLTDAFLANLQGEKPVFGTCPASYRIVSKPATDETPTPKATAAPTPTT